MSILNWNECFSEQARRCVRVDYSSLHVPHDPMELDQDVAHISLGNGFLVDIEWSDETEEYIVTLSRFFFENILVVRRLQDVDKVVDLVVNWAEITIAL